MNGSIYIESYSLLIEVENTDLSLKKVLSHSDDIFFDTISCKTADTVFLAINTILLHILATL